MISLNHLSVFVVLIVKLALQMSSAHETAKEEMMSIMHVIKNIFYPYLEETIILCNVMSGFLIVVSLLQSLINLIILTSNSVTGKQRVFFDPWRINHGFRVVPTLIRIRFHMSEVVAVALTLLVASDVLDTIIKPDLSLEEYGKILLVAVIRTFISYFLSQEIKELKEEAEEEKTLEGSSTKEAGSKHKKHE